VFLLNIIGNFPALLFLFFLVVGILFCHWLIICASNSDLVPRESVEKWLKYLREELPTVAFKCSTQQQRSNLGWKSSKKVKPNNTLQLSDCLGAETLLKLLKNYSRSYEVTKNHFYVQRSKLFLPFLSIFMFIFQVAIMFTSVLNFDNMVELYFTFSYCD
jgi:hypothetical protein